MTDAPASAPIVELQSLFEQLLQTLAEERTAMTEQDPEALTACVRKKYELCRAINAVFSANAPQLEALHTSTRLLEQFPDHKDVDPNHKKLLQLARTARDSNLVNGKILHRTQQSIREILGILSGTSLDGLYGQKGQQTATQLAGSRAVIRA